MALEAAHSSESRIYADANPSGFGASGRLPECNGILAIGDIGGEIRARQHGAMAVYDFTSLVDQIYLLAGIAEIRDDSRKVHHLAQAIDQRMR